MCINCAFAQLLFCEKAYRGACSSLSDYQSKDSVPGDRPVAPAVRGIHAIVSQEKALILAADDELLLGMVKGIRGGACGQIRFVQFGSVYVNPPVLQINRVARDANDS